MASVLNLSSKMQAGLDYLRQHGGAVERREGGFWMHPAAPEFKSGMEYVRTATIHALESRGLVMVAWRGKTPRATLTQSGINATNWTPISGDDSPACGVPGTHGACNKPVTGD